MAAPKMTAAEKKAAEAEKKRLAAAEAAFVAETNKTPAPPKVKPKVKPKPAPVAQLKTRANPRTNAEFIDPETGEPYRRTVDVDANPYDIPKALQRAGWDYQYWPVRVTGEPTDPSVAVAIREGGWRPCSPKDFPTLVPPGWDKPYIERGAQILYQRPMYLTQEARAADIKKAEDQRYDKLKGALAGPAELGKVARRVTSELDIHGSVGVAEKA